jgi:nucleotide-binding universal stress UspA family protein
VATDSPRLLTVLWSTDGSANARNAVPFLKQIILPAAGHLIVLSVAPHSFLSGARPDPAFLTHATTAARTKAIKEAEQLSMQEAVHLDPVGVALEAVSRWGNPIEQILRVSRVNRADIIVLGAKGHSNLGLILMGSVSQGVVQHASQPVLVARPGADQIRRILVGYHGSSAANRAMRFLQRLALPANVEVMLTYVIEPFGVPAGMPVSYRRRALEEAHTINEGQHRHAARALKEALGNLPWRVDSEIVSGQPGPELEAAARRHNADLIVVGSRRPSPVRHYLLGSTAEKLVRHSHTSVLVVR